MKEKWEIKKRRGKYEKKHIGKGKGKNLIGKGKWGKWNQKEIKRENKRIGKKRRTKQCETEKHEQNKWEKDKNKNG